MKNEIIIGLAGLVLSALTYFAGVIRTERRYKQTDKDNRSDAVLNIYMDFRAKSKTSGYDGLLKAGVATLSSDKEIRDLADKIMAHGETDPLNRQAGLLEGVDLKVFFDYAAKERVNFFRIEVKDVIERAKA